MLAGRRDPAGRHARRAARSGLVGFFAFSCMMSAAAAQVTGSDDQSWTRWLWWVLIAYMFMAQAEVCDEYFVTAISVMVERFNIPENVAGATVMALGCNGPELVVNSIGLFLVPDAGDVGTGTIVGSEIFNLLVILGGVAVVTARLPQEGHSLGHRQLKVAVLPFLRDCLFYALSIALLAWSLANGRVSPSNALVLCGAGVLYVLSVIFCEEPPPRPMSDSAAVKRYGSCEMQPDVEAALGTRKSTLRHLKSAVSFKTPSEPGDDDHYKHMKIIRRNHNRLQDRTGRMVEDVAVAVDESGQVIVANLQRRKSVYGVGPAVEEYTPIGVTRANGSVELEMADGLGGFQTFIAEETEAEEILEELQLLHREHGQEVKVRKNSVVLPVPDLHQSLRSRIAVAVHKFVHTLAFPITLVYDLTMGWCDPKKADKQDRWPFAFMMAMMWLAVASYAVVMSSQKLHDGFGIQNSILGVTVCAIGTSFPNFWASIAMARKGRGVMAVANALGSNVQNIFLALAVPWVFKVCLPGDTDYPVNTNGFGVSIQWMAGTLGLILLLTLPMGCSGGMVTITGWAGWLMLIAYATYLGSTIYSAL